MEKINQYTCEINTDKALKSLILWDLLNISDAIKEKGLIDEAASISNTIIPELEKIFNRK